MPDTIPHFRATDVLLYAPNRGSGLKVKVLEALVKANDLVVQRHGRPVRTPAELRAALAAEIDGALATLARSAVLVG